MLEVEFLVQTNVHLKCWYMLPNALPKCCELLCWKQKKKLINTFCQIAKWQVLSHYGFLKFLFYWNIVDLQCCIYFFCTAKWFSYTYMQTHTHIHIYTFFFLFFSIMAQMVKSLPGVRETQVPSLGWEDPLEKEISIHSSILAGKITWMGYSPWGCK